MRGLAGTPVLVTGGTGFIGGRLVERLTLEERAEVRAIVRQWHKAAWLARTPAELVPGDVTDGDSLVAAMSGREVVFHCVGVGAPETCWAVNVEGTRNVLAAARACGVRRVVYLSSIAVHGPHPPARADEDAPFVRTGNPYGDSKVAAEEVVRAEVARGGVEIVTLRPTFVWGPRSEWFSIAPVQAMRAGTFVLIDGGAGSCHAVHVDNVVDAILLAAVQPGVAGEAFFITDEPCTWRDFFGAYAAMPGVGIDRLPTARHEVLRMSNRLERWLAGAWDRVQWRPRHEPLRTALRTARFALRRMRTGRVGVSDWDIRKFSRRGGLDTRRARQHLGYRPRVLREDGMREVELWLRDQAFLPPLGNNGAGQVP